MDVMGCSDPAIWIYDIMAITYRYHYGIRNATEWDDKIHLDVLEPTTIEEKSIVSVENQALLVDDEISIDK